MSKIKKSNFFKGTQLASCLMLLIGISACSQAQEKPALDTPKTVTKQETPGQPNTSDQSKSKNPEAVPVDPEAQLLYVKKFVNEAMGINNSEQEKEKFTEFTFDQNKDFLIKVKVDENASPAFKDFSIKKNITDILTGIKLSGVNYQNVTLVTIESTGPDQSGKTEELVHANVTFSKSSIDKIDFESFNGQDIFRMADKITSLDPSL